VTPAEVMYHKYLTVVAEANCSPLPFIEWCDLCNYLVPVRFPMGFPLSSKPIDTGHAAFRKPRKPEDDRQREADVRANRLFVGELRPDGSVAPVRRPSAPIYGKSHLTARTCRACTEFLPAERFSKQGKGRRSICKACDNKRRRSKPQSA
jgi:hypothetical protein